MADTRSFGSAKSSKNKGKKKRTTKQSPSAPPPVAKGGVTETGATGANQAAAQSESDNGRYATYRADAPKAEDARPTLMDARPTILMNASDVQAQVTSPRSGKAAAAEGAKADPEGKRRTVVVQSHEVAVEGPDGSLQHSPEIELVEHELPTDAPLDPRLVLVDDADSERAAAFRVLRHHLLELGHPQVIAVSGPHDRCGKTTVAINLALALSECDRAQVLLVDGNLRRPELASIMRFIPPWCFAEQLAQHREQPLLPWGFVNIPELWLHVAAVNPRSDKQHRLDAPAFAIAMDRLRLANYDHICHRLPGSAGQCRRQPDSRCRRRCGPGGSHQEGHHS